MSERAHVTGYAYLVDLDPAGQLAAIGADAATDAAVTVFTTDGGRVADIAGRADGRVWALGFAPGAGPARLLLVIEDQGGYLPATWTADDGLVRHDWCRFDTEITAGGPGRAAPPRPAGPARPQPAARGGPRRADPDGRRHPDGQHPGRRGLAGR